ncbi:MULTISPECIES: nuclear transport factor 2 family protein [Phytobacter]|uniref:Polyketide cyclase n=1 Tax=Phytobacter diazotrophicus TaxID=395631 RepID=A0ABM7VUM1_9ENTR|nr:MULTISPECIES: nuclear transport factor 2 family protein [Phytobacter]MDU4154493.1 nuclear transport factor 2 family protein [Enterobacteriaceae bacterium]MDU7378908.1 nuclear transport factor 2 family protein [Enterobacteriaceae bacterium]BBE77369.1 polyketide cyclase [Phytobacter sp. MRY16-398]BDD50842.1 polyketide cyclase [Phytobacter diazotrophicus]BEG81871.1 nuclear transport factor 2 family protein [Phytobacter diazotrophicus]
MSLLLPHAIATYFAISNGGDIASVQHCFTTDAIVKDEGKTHHGHTAIAAWQRAAQAAFDYSVEPLEMHSEGERAIVTSKVVGNFPGSPVTLRHAFGLVGDKINTLEIV